jgi:hypothetical protein
LVKYLLIIFLLYTAILSAQETDTVKIIIPADTLSADTLSLLDSLALADTAGLLSDSINILKADTIQPVYQKSFYNKSFFINKTEFYRRSYNYSGDIFNLVPFIFVPGHGLAGHPDNLMMFGTGSLQNTYLYNGISLNDYSELPFDLNRISSEYIDSVEILPLPRGFIYGINNNQAAVNFLGKDFLSISPYTRIKYYEGPYGEGFIDGTFNSIIFRDFNLYIDITNRKSDERYLNSGTDYSMWSASLQLKYLLNENINILSGYIYSNTNTGVGGGINIFNLPATINDFSEAIYSERLASVFYPTLRFNTFMDNVYIKSLATFGTFSFTDLSLYYRSNRTELNGPLEAGYFDNLFKSKITGVALNQTFSYSFLNLNLLANSESASLRNNLGFRENPGMNSQNVTNLSFAGIVSASLLKSAVTPSVFYKINHEKYNQAADYSGYGADVSLKLPMNSNLYAGYSEFGNKYLTGKSKNIQAGFSYNNNHSFKAGISYFDIQRQPLINITDTILNINSAYYYPAGISGISMDMNVLIGSFLIEGKIDYYRDKNRDIPVILPSTYITGGVYYKDLLFSDNLDFKGGINLFYYGRRNLNLSPEAFIIYQGNTAGPDVRLDLFISGEIQKRAIIFFTWENFLDRRYFIIPFYPMPPAGIRFGVAWELFN